MKLTQKFSSFFKTRPFLFYLFLGICLCSFISQCILVYGPEIQESWRISKQENLFKDFWEKEGANQFKSIGLTPTEELYQEELNAYLKKYKEKNPTLFPDKRVLEMKQEFQKWWETGGSLSYAVNHVVPDKKLYQKELAKHVKSYTDTKTIFRFRLNTKEPEAGQILLHWLLFPNMWVFIVHLICLLLFAGTIESRFGKTIGSGLFFGSIFLGSCFLLVLGEASFFVNHTESYMGMTIGVVFLLGCLCRGYQNALIEKKRIFAISLLLTLNILILWFTCSQIYVAAIIISVLFFIGGIFAGKFIPLPKKSKREIEKEKQLEKMNQPKENLTEVRKKKTRATLDEGFSCAMKGDFALAGKHLSEAMHALLLETDADKETLTDIAKKITNPSLYIEISSTQWQEWGVAAYQKRIYEAALLFLEKSLVSEKDEKMARKALFLIGEIRITQNLNPEEGQKRLEKVLSLSESDIFATQAKKILDKWNNQPK